MTIKRDLKPMKYPAELHIRLDENTKQHLIQVANQYSSSPSQIVRHLLNQNLHQLDKNRMYV